MTDERYTHIISVFVNFIEWQIATSITEPYFYKTWQYIISNKSAINVFILIFVLVIEHSANVLKRTRKIKEVISTPTRFSSRIKKSRIM